MLGKICDQNFPVQNASTIIIRGQCHVISNLRQEYNFVGQLGFTGTDSASWPFVIHVGLNPCMMDT